MKKGKLELRLYGLVPYNISPIQQGIQYGHANDVFKVKYPKDPLYNEWIKNWKTYIILNGGTTNENPKRLGTMQKHLATLKANNIKVATFYEPDLNDTLTGIVFIAEERAFNDKKYPDPYEMYKSRSVTDNYWNKKWEREIGKQNYFLRTFLKQFRLA